MGWLEVSAAVSVVAFGYWLYYKTYVCRFPKLVGNGFLRALVEKECKSALRKYEPPVLLHESHIMTVLGSRLRMKKWPIRRVREILIAADGGEIVLDWLYESDFETADDIKKTPDNKPERILVGNSGIVLILPGLTGNAEQTYVKGIAYRAFALDLQPVVFNYRGAVGRKLTTPKTYCAAITDDLEEAIIQIRSGVPSTTRLYAFGASMGGIQLVNYLGRLPGRHLLDGVMGVSVAWDLLESARTLEQPLNWLLFNRTLVNNLKQFVRCNLFVNENFKITGVDETKTLASRTIREFDSTFTAPMFGFRDVNDYYSVASPVTQLKNISVPLLLLQAEDDVFSPAHTLPYKEVNKNDNVCMIVTSHGGHIGFLMRAHGLNGENLVECLFEEYMTALMQNSSSEDEPRLSRQTESV